MSRRCDVPLLALAAVLAAQHAAAAVAAPATVTALPRAAPADPMAALRAMTQRRTRGDCAAQAVATTDIVVCARPNDQALPLREVYGPVPGSTDGAAVDPSRVPCGASISNQCWGGVDVIGTIGGAIGLVGLLLDPDRNLGEGTPIPDRFRGANR